MLAKSYVPKIYYGYVIVSISFLIILLMQGMNRAYGVLFASLQADFGWSRALISGAGSLSALLAGLFAIPAGRFTDKYGARIVMTISGCFLGVGYFLMSQVDSVWQLYLYFGVVVGIGSSTGDASLLPTAAAWFPRRMGIMSSIVKTGTGLGIIAMPALAGWLILNNGWRDSYAILSLVCLVPTVLLSQLFRRAPAGVGLSKSGDRSIPIGQGTSLREAVGTKEFWAVCGMGFMIGYCTNSIMIHAAPFAVDLGATPVAAAGMLSIIGGTSIIGRLVMGASGDRLGDKRAMLICLLIFVAALVWLQFTRTLEALTFFVIMYGFAHGGVFAVESPLIAEVFGTRSHGAILGTMIFVVQSGATIGPVLTGYIFDVTRSYQMAFLILVLAISIALGLSILAKPVTAGTPG